MFRSSIVIPIILPNMDAASPRDANYGMHGDTYSVKLKDLRGEYQKKNPEWETLSTPFHHPDAGVSSFGYSEFDLELAQNPMRILIIEHHILVIQGGEDVPQLHAKSVFQIQDFEVEAFEDCGISFVILLNNVKGQMLWSNFDCGENTLFDALREPKNWRLSLQIDYSKQPNAAYLDECEPPSHWYATGAELAREYFCVKEPIRSQLDYHCPKLYFSWFFWLKKRKDLAEIAPFDGFDPNKPEHLLQQIDDACEREEQALENLESPDTTSRPEIMEQKFVAWGKEYRRMIELERFHKMYVLTERQLKEAENEGFVEYVSKLGIWLPKHHKY